jgi:hypothetical protein
MTTTDHLTKRMRQWSLILPIIGLGVAGAIVWHQCDRRDRISREIASIEREIKLIRGVSPSFSEGAPHSDHEGDHEHDHDHDKGGHSG